MIRAVAGLLLWLFALPALAQSFPPLTGRVVDGANILSPAVEQQLTEKLAALETRSGAQLAVVTVPSLQGYEIEEYGYKLGRAWGIGTAEKDDGALFLVAPNERRVRIEVGYGLEPVLTDALSSTILQSQVLPRFRDGDMEGGVVAGVDATIEQISLPPAEAQRRVSIAEAHQEASEKGDFPGGLLIFLLFVFFVVLPILTHRGRRRRRRGLAGVAEAILWSAATSSWSGGGGGRSSGGGGGFSGGGGSFGGGGASGSW
jgi:uncharacterized protein